VLYIYRKPSNMGWVDGWLNRFQPGRRNAWVDRMCHLRLGEQATRVASLICCSLGKMDSWCFMVDWTGVYDIYIYYIYLHIYIYYIFLFIYIRMQIPGYVVAQLYKRVSRWCTRITSISTAPSGLKMMTIWPYATSPYVFFLGVPPKNTVSFKDV
jgi:hypothetical protein